MDPLGPPEDGPGKKPAGCLTGRADARKRGRVSQPLAGGSADDQQAHAAEIFGQELAVRAWG